MEIRTTSDPIDRDGGQTSPESASTGVDDGVTRATSASRASSKSAEKATKKRGRPAGEVRLQQITTNYRPELVDAIERARQRRQKRNPSREVTMSETIRELLLKALAAEDGAQLQPDLPLSEASTKST